MQINIQPHTGVDIPYVENTHKHACYFGKLDTSVFAFAFLISIYLFFFQESTWTICTKLVIHLLTSSGTQDYTNIYFRPFFCKKLTELCEHLTNKCCPRKQVDADHQ